MKFISTLASLLTVLLVGCASTSGIAPVQGESLAGLRTEKIIVNNTLATKKINYVETLFRLLWLETKTSSQDFSGIWNPDPDLTAFTTARLRQQGFSATSIYDVLNQDAIADANKSWGEFIVSGSTENHPIFTGVKVIPAREFFLSPQVAESLKPLVNMLREKGYKYLVQLSAMDITGNAPGYGMVSVAAVQMVQVIDITTNKTIWAGPAWHSEIYQLGGDLKALETDGMKKTKEGMAAGIAKINFDVLWGLSTVK